MAVGAFATMTAAPFSQRVLGANDRISIGTIGARGQGTNVSSNLVKCPGVECIAACDVDRRVLDRFTKIMKKRHNLSIKTYSDFRNLLEQKEIDAVVITTPDHWHALPFIYACEAGKDIYLEKPVSYSIVEGRAMVNAAKKFKSVVQVGSWDRSLQHVQDSIDYIHDGKLGDISVCRAWFTMTEGNIGKLSPSDPPEEFDWNFWLGPAPQVPFQRNRNHWNWRFFYDYAGGLTSCWGAHMMDIVCLGMKNWDPVKVSSYGGKLVFDDDRDTPDTQVAIFKFKDFILHWEMRCGNPRPLDGMASNFGAEWIGTTGTLGVHRNKWEYYYVKKPKRTEKEIIPETINEINTTHYQNFVDCIRSRETPRSDIESAHKTAVLGHLANIAYRSDKEIIWDAERELISNAPDAMNCPQFQREYRTPWKLPIHKI